MKQKINLCFLFAIVISSGYTMYKANSKQQLHCSTLTSIKALASNENGGSSENNGGPYCHTKESFNLEFKDCNGIELISRRIKTFDCEGGGFGTCSKGKIYYIYDCHGQEVAENDFRVPATCI